MHAIRDSHTQVAEATYDGPKDENKPATHEMTDGVHSAVDADEGDAGVHDGILEWLVDFRDLEEVSRIGDDEPGSRAGLGADNSVAEESSTEVGACEFGPSDRVSLQDE
jgi:hypothetical protein